MNKWISINERLPKCEEEVLVVAKRGSSMIITTAIYEDGTIPTEDSDWRWSDIDEEYDEENDVYLVPAGWWEYRHYNDGDTYNLAIDDEVIYWTPLPVLPSEIEFFETEPWIDESPFTGNCLMYPTYMKKDGEEFFVMNRSPVIQLYLPSTLLLLTVLIQELHFCVRRSFRLISRLHLCKRVRRFR